MIASAQRSRASSTSASVIVSTFTSSVVSSVVSVVDSVAESVVEQPAIASVNVDSKNSFFIIRLSPLKTD